MYGGGIESSARIRVESVFWIMSRYTDTAADVTVRVRSGFSDVGLWILL